MFNYVEISFPNTSLQPKRVYSLTLYQNRYEHEIAVIQFRDWAVQYDVIESGSPINFLLNKNGKSRNFYGYVHHVNVDRTPGSFLTEVVAVSPSMKMKSESQAVYTDLSADAIVQKIAKKHNFVAFTVPHPRIYPQISQAGHTDWELLVRLAKQSGYSLRTENTELYFQPMLYDYNNLLVSAPRFIMREANNPSGSNLYSFTPTISESLSFEGDMKAAIAVSGMDASSKSVMSLTKQKRRKSTKFKHTTEFFDKFNTNVVATDPEIAAYEAEAAENRTVFPYRATAEVRGTPNLRPDMPIYLEGVGGYYTGYWTILGTEHIVVEEERNSQKYTTIVHLGADSLGTAVSLVGGETITPSKREERVIIPGVRQTNIPPKTTIRRTAPNTSPKYKGSFGNPTNRAKPVELDSPTWKTATATLDPVTQSNTSKAPQSNRLLNKVAKIL